ncbi:unnamed protein product [Bursaphelenchus xylophilus]|uniref:(pine wood nematode) hypothetical protein n=1 Tax=Bursaphelenchus xylophilus TaxID=6326 RepID=A0A1I7S102_BURXY|nr:unnamed protein product [Bursaphelenchus xylophilus]CAG9087953.1 unnamed protein product [Bursaphelenchus xylophilus]
MASVNENSARFVHSPQGCSTNPPALIKTDLKENARENAHQSHDVTGPQKYTTIHTETTTIVMPVPQEGVRMIFYDDPASSSSEDEASIKSSSESESETSDFTDSESDSCSSPQKKMIKRS